MSTFVPSKSRSTAETVADFCRRTDLARAPITDMPGIGEAGETGLANNSITQITQLFGQFLLLDNGARDCQEVCDAMMEVSPPLFFLFLSLLFHIYFFMVDSTSFSFFSTNFLLLLLLLFFIFFLLLRFLPATLQWLNDNGVGRAHGHTVVFCIANYLHEKQLFTYDINE